MRMAGRILVLFISSISLFVEGYRVVREANSALAVEDPTNKTNETDPADFELPDGIYMLNSTDGCYRDAAQFPPGDRPGRYWRGNDLCWSNLREVLERNSQRREAQRLQNQSTELTAQPGYRLMMGRVYKRFFRENPFHGKPMLYPFDMEWYYTRVLDQWSVAWNWNSTDPSTPFQVRMWDGQNVSEKIFNEKGQWKDWLQMVLESAIAPDGAFDEDCLKCVRTTCSDSDVYMKQQFYLERMESGDVFPILGTGRNGTQPMASQMAGKYHFLGKWMAKAYLLQEDVFAPASFHQLIYDSLVAGEPVKPQTEAHYSEQDTIQECEWLAAISGNRSMPALRTYAWMTSCDQVKDPGTGTYAHQDCYVPLYRDEGMWESLNVTWGLVAPNGSEPSDSVPLDSAREYTQQTCLEVWNRDVVEPVEAIVKGFREMIPAETFWKKLKGASQLKRLIEGSQEVDVDNFLARVVWQGGPWSGADRQVMEEVMRELGKQGSGLPILKQPLSKLLRYITGSSTEPVHAEDEFLGEPLEKIVFVKADTDDGQCHLPQSLKDSHLWVAAPCLIEKALLMEQLHLQIISPSYTKQLGEQTHLLGFDDVLLAGMLAGESRERTYEKQPPVSQGLRGEAQVEFNFTLLLLHDLTFKEDIQVDVEESNASVFQQMLSTLHNSTQWEWDWSKIRIVYSGSNSDLSVSEGRKKEWLQLVLESAVCPSEELLSGPATANGLACLSGECENLTTPQYFLKNLPSGDVVPIHSAGKLSAGAKNHFYVLGKWIARAYIIDPRVFAPLPLHNFIYESLVAGKPTATIGAAHYSKDDTIEECERLVSILGNRRLEDVGPYAWKSCDAVQDADTGKYVQDDCYVPLYRSPDTWKELDIKWGAAAPNGVEPYDSVPYERAREYTEQNCRYLWETGFADPVEEIIKGFREVIPTDKMFWKKLQGASHLKQLVEGSHEVDAESFLARVVWQGPWSEADRQMMEGVMGELHQQGSGLPIQKKPLSKLLRYITGSSRKPVPELDGFVNETSHKIVFVKDGTDDDKCHRPLSVQNNRLWVSEECLTSKALLMEQFDRPLVSPQTGQDIHLLGFMDDFLDAENERRKLKGQPLLDTGLRGLAQRGFDIIDAEWPRLEVNRQGNTSVFQQTQAEFRAVPTRLYVKWGKISFAGEAGVDAGGLKKEWLQLVLETAVLPDANDKSKENLECLRGECENITTVQCFLETLPSGDVVPIMHSGHGKLSAGAKEHFHFIGKWMARAYVIENMVSAPLSFHDLIYKSLIAGTPRPPQVQAVHYSEEDKIKECEWLVAVSGSRRPQEVGSYGWRSCDGVQDPETGKYTEEGCYKPLYRAGDMWEWLYNEWGPAAPDGVEPSDLVPFERAREYTERNCRYLWETDFAEPVQEIIDGFREVVGGKLFWRKLKGESELKELIEGSQEVDLEALLAAAMWDGTWSSSDKNVFKAVLGELRKEGEGKAMLEKPLNRLLRFFTGAYKAPLKGWASAPPKFQKKMKPRCEPLTSHTCFNTLEIPSPCLENKENLTEMMKESIAVQDFGQV